MPKSHRQAERTQAHVGASVKRFGLEEWVWIAVIALAVLVMLWVTLRPLLP